MKNIIKFILIIGVFLAIYILGGRLVDAIMPNHDSTHNSSLLLLYGGMTGYILFIVFVVVLQEEGFSKLSVYRPKTSKLMHFIYILVAVSFVMYAFVSFNLQFSILMALLFMLITAALDMVRDKLFQETQGNPLHPKRII
ncbi:MAG: hypothetical protein Q7I99_01605 [Acholeplasmataceae bacterium]|nr:hypothetical protein [Acholeplasmataceae bacterium]